MGKTAEEYEETRGNIYWEEWDYPNWGQLRELSYSGIIQLKNGRKSKELVKLILEFMAIDNEGHFYH